MGGNSTYNPPPFYRPNTRIGFLQVPYLALVNQMDEDWATLKYREVVYEWTNRWWRQNPYTTGAYNTPTKTVPVNYAGPATFGAGDLTNVGYDFVTLMSENAAPGKLTTRTAAQMFGDISGSLVLMDWVVRLVNLGAGGPLVLAPGGGVSFIGAVATAIYPEFYSELVFTFTSPTTATITAASIAQPWKGVS